MTESIVDRSAVEIIAYPALAVVGVAIGLIAGYLEFHDPHVAEVFGCGMVYQYERTLFATKGFRSHANDDHLESCNKIKAHAFAGGLVIDDTADLEMLDKNGRLIPEFHPAKCGVGSCDY